MTKSDPNLVLELPSVLRPVIGSTTMNVRGGSITDALEDAFRQTPILRHHLTLESGEVRPHILVLVGDETIAPADFATHPLHEGETLRVFQAISGG